MRLIFIALLALFLSGCYNYPSSGKVLEVELWDGRVFEVDAVCNTNPNVVQVRVEGSLWLNLDHSQIKKIREIVPGSLSRTGDYERGYKDGQIDYHNKKVCWTPVLNDRREIVFTDTCSH